MAAIDIGKAATAGLRVIARNPVAVLVWAAVLLLVGVLPVAGLMTTMLGSIVELAEAERAGVEPSSEAIMPMISAVFAMQPVLLITGIAVRAILTAAIFRAVLEPDEKRWFYLRLGAQEMWVGLMVIVLWVLLSLVSTPVGFLLMPIMMIVAVAAGNDPTMFILPTVAAVLAMVGVLAWVMLRFSMALPMTFSERKFRLFESWTLTRGRTLQLLGVGVLLVLMVVLLEAVVIGVFVAISFALHGAGGFDEAAVTAFFAQDASIWMAELAPWAIGVAVLGALLGAAATTVMVAPWAEVYRQLSGARAEPSA